MLGNLNKIYLNILWVSYIYRGKFMLDIVEDLCNHFINNFYLVVKIIFVYIIYMLLYRLLKKSNLYKQKPKNVIYSILFLDVFIIVFITFISLVVMQSNTSNFILTPILFIVVGIFMFIPLKLYILLDTYIYLRKQELVMLDNNSEYKENNKDTFLLAMLIFSSPFLVFLMSL